MEMYHVPGNHNYMIQYTTPYEQGLFFPGYYCSGFDWEEHQRVFGVDAPEFQYAAGAQNESLPYVYGYTQSPYNPYNPYIPGATAMIGLDHQFNSPHGTSSSNVSQTGFSSQASTSFGSTLAVDQHPNGRLPSHHNKLKASVPSSSAAGAALSDFGTHNQGQPGRSLEGINSLADQNRGPRVARPRNELAVKAYTTSAGVTNPQGNITIYTDQYNKDTFQVEYTNAKFFVIKSYSEDDVHKSVKYNVWSSTPNGNKKLNGAFEDAQRIATRNPGGCPIFLFFSVNMSGQFCGVAEMIGPVDFSRDMDFWQQDKWNGSFPVKWHFIKDVPNTSLRHIVLENNENKPVTNSRDTQEIMYKKGIEMLRTFKSYTFKSCLFDDFMFYENRQKLLQEEKVVSLVRSFECPFFAVATGPPRKLNSVVGESAYSNKPMNVTNTRHEHKGVQVKDDGDDVYSTLKIGALSIEAIPKPGSSTTVVKGPAFDVKVGSVPLKLNGSVDESSRLGILTFGTIPTDPKALLPERGPEKHK